jgi:uncharacterized protein YecE (DUF72 family)
MGSIDIGTTSWGDPSPTRSGRFYPSAVSTAEARLRHYARQFSLVEIDATHYGIKSWRTAADWIGRTPPRFVFDVRAFRLFTQHRTPVSALPSDLRRELGDVESVHYDQVPKAVRDELWRRFRNMLQPLARANKLGVVLLPFAPWFIHGRTSVAHLERCVQALDGFVVAVELRNKTWFSARNREQSLSLVRELGAVHVVADEPKDSSFPVPALWEVTRPDLAVVRLHGRREATGPASALPSAARRLGYCYSRRELEALLPRLRSLSHRASRVHVLFSNRQGDHAQRNASSLGRLLETRADEAALAAVPA